MRALLAVLLLYTGAAQAGEALRPLPYATITDGPHWRVDFDTLPPRAEPGHILNAPLRYPGLWIGERLAGEGVTPDPSGHFDRITGTPQPPLRPQAGAEGHSLAVASHRGFGSNALFPLGPDGGAQRSGRGEGAVTLVFDTPPEALGLKIHADYADPLGNRPAPGRVWLAFLDRTGAETARATLDMTHGVQRFGWLLLAPVRAVRIETDDPGGIALDDIVWPRPAPLG